MLPVSPPVKLTPTDVLDWQIISAGSFAVVFKPDRGYVRIDQKWCPGLCAGSIHPRMIWILGF